MKGQYFRCILGALFYFIHTTPLYAGPPEDIFGAGGRVQAMGGAGVAFSQDASSTFYNPALLTKCPKQTFSLGYQMAQTNFNVKDNKKALVTNKQLGFAQTANLGACLSPFTNAGFGFYASFPLQVPLQIPDIESLNSTPQFLRYGSNATFPSAVVGLAYAPIRQLSLGLSAALSAAVSIQQSINMPTFASTVSPQITPRIAIIAGVLAEPIEQLRLSLVYRQVSFGKFNVDVNTEINYWFNFSIPLLLGSTLGYSPEQIAFGLSYRINSSWLVGADITYYRWSEYAGPFMSAEAKGGSSLITFPKKETFSFHDTFVPRVGFECSLNEKTQLRAGYAFQMSPTEMPSEISNLLDSDVHHVTLGAGYRLISSSHFAMTLDGFVAVDVMPPKAVHKSASQPEPRNYEYGGTAISAGLTLKAEY